MYPKIHSVFISFKGLAFKRVALVFGLALWLSLSYYAYGADQRLNINTASPAALAEQLPGIGPAKARAIVDYREQHGLFSNIDLLIEVHGIGPGTLQKIRPLIFVGDSKSDALHEKTQTEQDLATQKAVRAAINVAKRYESQVHD